MTIDRDGWLIWWAYLLFGEPPSSGQTVSLCRLFWLSVGTTVAAALGVALVVLLGIVCYQQPWQVVTVIGGIVGIVGGVVLLAWTTTKVQDFAHRESAAAVLLTGFKNKVCPRIRVK